MTNGREYPLRPIVGVSAIVKKGGKVLLVKRNTSPAKGRWAFPGGAVELGERIEQAVRREVLEEVGLRIGLDGILDVIDDVHLDDGGRVRYHFILVEFMARYVGGAVKLNSESSAYKWFDPSEVESLDATSSTKDWARRLSLSSDEHQSSVGPSRVHRGR